MPRYKDITTGQLTPDKPVRISNYHPSTDTTITFEGPIVEVITEAIPQDSVIDMSVARQIMRPFAVTFAGGHTAAILAADGWECVEIHQVLPDLPTTTGSIIRIENKAAIYKRASYADVEPVAVYGWFWADDPDLETEVPEADLDRAEILHRAF